VASPGGTPAALPSTSNTANKTAPGTKTTSQS
jgi:hypothetical protein